MSIPLPKPFLKWAGGKGQLLDELLQHAPLSFKNYHEPFVGGGALFFALYRARRLVAPEHTAYLMDMNAELMITYQAIKNQVDNVIERLKVPKYEKNHFYAVRDIDPRGLEPHRVAARMIYLNRTCFNGLYRVNAEGKFNTPFGKYKNPKICDEENLRSVSVALQNTTLMHRDFATVLLHSHPGDFVYLDPPYVPTSETADFTQYTADGFDITSQERLAKTFDQLIERGIHAMMSNADVPWVRERYKNHRLIRVWAERAINSKKEKRGAVPELIIVPR